MFRPLRLCTSCSTTVSPLDVLVCWQHSTKWLLQTGVTGYLIIVVWVWDRGSLICTKLLLEVWQKHTPRFWCRYEFTKTGSRHPNSRFTRSKSEPMAQTPANRCLRIHSSTRVVVVTAEACPILKRRLWWDLLTKIFGLINCIEHWTPQKTLGQCRLEFTPPHTAWSFVSREVARS